MSASPQSQIIILDPTIAALIQEMANLRERCDDLSKELRMFREGFDKEITNLSEQDEIQLKLIKSLKITLQPDPQPAQRDRGDVLKALIAANDGKLLSKTAREKMHLDAPTFSKLVDSMPQDIEQKPFYKDKRQKILVLR